MSTLDKIPIWNFIAMRYMMPQVQKIVENWRVEPNQVVEKLIEHFRELGIYQVQRGQEDLVIKSMLFLLKNSPDIHRLLQRTRQDEIRRQRHRHAD